MIARQELGLLEQTHLITLPFPLATKRKSLANIMSFLFSSLLK